MRQFDAHVFELACVEIVGHFRVEGCAAREDVQAHVVRAEEVDCVECAGVGEGGEGEGVGVGVEEGEPVVEVGCGGGGVEAG